MMNSANREDIGWANTTHLSNIAVFVSGSGTNLQALMNACDSGELLATVSIVVTDNPDCYAIKRAEAARIPVHIHDRKMLRQMDASQKEKINKELVDKLTELDIELIVLAGYLSILDQSLVDAFPKKIINLHPALIPAYCGKGYYGDRVHKAVLENNETESGITIHFVDGGIDTGEIILQKKIPVFPEDTVETLAARIHELEHENLKQVVRDVLNKNEIF